MTFNITSNLNSYGGRNKWSVPIGTTRNIRGSANRIYNYCDRTTNDPLYCMFQFTPPKPIKGNLIFLYDFTGTNITESMVLDNLPVKILPRVFEITPKVTITGNKVYVEIDSYLYESSSYSNDFGFTFNLQSSILTFYNSFTANLTFVKNRNFPFSRTGRQFAGLTLPFNKLSLSKPYFLPGTSLAHCFSGCTLFNQDIGYWNVSNITNMSFMFYLATAFNNGSSPTISNWTAPLCTDFTNMFKLASSFNQPLTNLVKTSNVSTTMLQMFQNATAFNQNIGEWDVSKVTSMLSMFELTPFNNGGSSTISNWSAPLCTTFAGMFVSATSFNQPLTNLVQTSNVSTAMNIMFENATAFDQNIGGWDVSKVTTMSNMFYNAINFNNGDSDQINDWQAPLCTTFAGMFHLASSFDQPLTNLVQTSNVSTTMLQMFREATAFNQNIGNWDVSKVTNMASMFESTNFNNGSSSTISNWTAPYCTDFTNMFKLATSFNQPLTKLVKTSYVSTTMLQMFQNATAFNQNIGEWDVSKVTSMLSMFELTQFNNGNSDTISNWEAPLCTMFAGMFVSATSFNQPLTNLVKTSGVESCSMNIMFENATAFNQDIGEWDVSKVTTMSNMFYNAINFNNGSSSTISNWSAPYCTRFAGMFNSNTNSAFNQPLTKLVKTSYVSTTMANMFQNATVFNQNIGEWDVSKVTNMAAMFQNATAFNNGSSDTIKYWEAPYCTDFTNMFYLATSFNQPLTNLVDTSGVTSCTMLNMFRDARAFNNGETGLQNIPNINPNPPGANYTNTTKILTCPGATFLSSLLVNDVLIIQTSTIVYSSAIQTIASDTSLTLTTAFGSDISTGIISIQKQIPGSNPLNWNTSNVTSLANMFRNAIFFNQNITTNGNIWNTYKVTNLTNMFLGSSSSLINLFNNGQIITGQTAPMGWTFNPTTPPTSTNYRTNCRLTASNKPTSLL